MSGKPSSDPVGKSDHTPKQITKNPDVSTSSIVLAKFIGQYNNISSQAYMQGVRQSDR